MADQFTEYEVNKIFRKASNEEYIYMRVEYNKYLELTYRVPLEFKEIETPQWSHVRSIKLIGGHYEIVVQIFKGSRLYSMEAVLESDFLKIKL